MTSATPRTAARKGRGAPAGLLLLTLGIGLIAMALPASAGSPYRYVGAATVVTQVNGQTVVDNGVVQCTMALDSGAGGFCIPFADIAASGNTLTVIDEAVGVNLSYQVCLDNNGSGTCGDTNFDGSCADQIWYSHTSDPSVYRNPMSVPTAHAAGCPGSRDFDGLVVFVCEGVHDNHAETATSGQGILSTASATAGFTEPGPPVPFCGGPLLPFKSYLVAPAASAPNGFSDSGVVSGIVMVSTGSTTCGTGSGGLGLPGPAQHITGSWRWATTTMVAAVNGLGALDACGSLGSVGGVGAACGVSRGHDGAGTMTFNAGTVSLSDIHWTTSAGSVLPVRARAAGLGASELVAIIALQGGAPCVTNNATSFSAVGVFGLL